MNIRIITPTGTVFEGDAQKVELPSVMGRMQVLYNHAPLLAALTPGVVRVDDRDFPVSGGVARVENNSITVCAE